jgi:membrane protein
MASRLQQQDKKGSMAVKFRRYFNLLKDAGNEFSDDNATKLSASLAYYTIFAIAPLLLVVITLTGFFFKRSDIDAHLADQIQSLVGKQGTDALLTMLDNIQKQHNTGLFGVIGVIVLVFGATGVFTEIQSSINYIWSIRAKPKRSWLKYITNRLLSFSLIVGIGFLLIASLLVNVVMDLLTERLQHLFGSADIILFKGLNVLILFVIITFLFGIIYKVLPDAKIHWRDALAGASFTGILFIIGKFLIGLYLGSSSVANTFGAAASFIILLSWVYYTAIILYFGAEFTKVYALKQGKGITVNDTAVFIVKREAKELPDAVDHPNVASEHQQKKA